YVWPTRLVTALLWYAIRKCSSRSAGSPSLHRLRLASQGRSPRSSPESPSHHWFFLCVWSWNFSVICVFARRCHERQFSFNGLLNLSIWHLGLFCEPLRDNREIPAVKEI